jgi:hypothetical protein
MNNQASSSSSSTSTSTLQPFLNLANQEYEALANYCNSLSHLTHAIHAPKQQQQQNKQQQRQRQRYRRPRQSQSKIMDPNLFLQQPSTSSSYSSSYSSTRNLQLNALIEYQNTLQILQNIHSKLVQCQQKQTKKNMNNEGESEASIISLRHLELSTRILKTCSSSMKYGYGPLYENGIIKNLAGSNTGTSGTGNDNDSDSLEDWHEIRMVALTSYRGSIARLKLFIERE